MAEKDNKFTIMFIKPDAVNDGLVDFIIADFLKVGFIPVFSKNIELNFDQARMIYHDHMNNLNYKFAIQSLIQEDSCKFGYLFLLKREEGDALLMAQRLKGRADTAWIKGKISSLFKERITRKRYRRR